MTVNITQNDIRQLIAEPSVEVRSDIARKVCCGFNEGNYKGRERQLAEEIIRLLLKDTALRVRAVLAEELRDNPAVPHDIILKMTQDDMEVAGPILTHSPVLSEEDLIAIVDATHHVARLMAIASRQTLSVPLSQALIETGERQVISAVMRHSGAQIDESIYAYMLEEFANDNSMLQELVYRGGLPYTVAEKLFTLVSDQLRKDLTKRYRLSRHVIDEATTNARSTAVLQFMSPWMSQHDIQALVDHMHKNKRLTHSVVLRSLCIGDLRFFETAMAKLVGIPVSNARILMMDPGELGFQAFYDSSNMPTDFREAVHILFKLAQEETFFGKFHCEDFSQRIMVRIAQGHYDKNIPNMPYLMAIIGRGGDPESHVIQ